MWAERQQCRQQQRQILVFNCSLGPAAAPPAAAQALQAEGAEGESRGAEGRVQGS